MKKEVEKAKRAMLAVPKQEVIHPPEDYLSTSITLINLAISGHPDRGLCKGHIYRFKGRSASGKTFITRGCLAEACINPYFDGYELIYDDIERGALMDTVKFYGQRLADRITSPARSKDRTPIYSVYTSDFYRRLQKKLEDGKKLIWVTDSLDALKPDQSSKMSDGKAKAHSQGLREIVDLVDQTKSIVILISQARQSMNQMSFVPQDITSGGMALEFYSTVEVELRKIKNLRTAYKDRKYTVGSVISATVKKNRVAGSVDQTVYFSFRPDYGVDDIGSNIDFLVSCKHWPKTKGIIAATELDFHGSRDKLIRFVEANDKIGVLRLITANAWDEIQKAIRVKRPPRYT